jgi:hypothetical protein
MSAYLQEHKANKVALSPHDARCAAVEQHMHRLRRYELDLIPQTSDCEHTRRAVAVTASRAQELMLLAPALQRLEINTGDVCGGQCCSGSR